MGKLYLFPRPRILKPEDIGDTKLNQELSEQQEKYRSWPVNPDSWFQRRLALVKNQGNGKG